MNLPFFAVKAWGGPESGRKKFEKCLPAGTGTKIYFSRMVVFVADDLGFLWPGIPKLVTELCLPQNTACDQKEA